MNQENDHVVSALLAKYDELASQLTENKKREKQIFKALEHVGETLRLYRPTMRIRPISPRRPQRPRIVKHGTYTRETLAVLREADRPLTGREIAERVMIERGIANPDPREVGRLTPLIGMVLNSRERKGLVTVTGNPKRWEIVR